jgi:hypothetical protein
MGEVLLNFRSAAAQIKATDEGHENDATRYQEIVGHGTGEAGSVL